MSARGVLVVALILASPMMMNLADDSGEIDDESPVFSTGHSAVYINEIMPNADGSDQGVFPNGEWVELHNSGTVGVSLVSWTLEDVGGWVHPIDSSTWVGFDQLDNPYVISAGSYAVIAENEVGTLRLDNAGETLYLKDASGAIIHTVTTGEASNGVSKIPAADSSADWVDSGGNTPGAENSEGAGPLQLDWSYLDAPVLSFAISADGEYITAGGEDAKVHLFDKDSSAPLWSHDTQGDILSLDISADGQYTVVGSTTHYVYLFNKDDNGDYSWAHPVGGDVNSVAMSSNGNYIVAGTSAGSNSRVYLFSTSSDTPIWSYTAGEAIRTVAISDDGGYITAGGYTNMVYLFSKNSGTPLWDYNTGTDVYSVDISADGQYIVAGDRNGDVHLFSKDSSTPLWDDHAYTPATSWSDVAISADGEYIVVGTTDGSVLLHARERGGYPLWSHRLNSSILTLQIYDVAISENGEFIVAGDNEGNVILFDKDSSTPQSIANIYPDSYNCNFAMTGCFVWVSMSADGRHIVAGSHDAGVYKFSNTDVNTNSQGDCNPDNAATATVTITDLTEINNGDKVTLVAADWTSHDFTAGDVAGGGIWIAETNNNASATNLAAQINANAKFSATAVSAVVTITQVTAGAGGNTTVTLTDSGAAGMSKTDFTGGCDIQVGCNPDNTATATITNTDNQELLSGGATVITITTTEGTTVTATAHASTTTSDGSDSGTFAVGASGSDTMDNLTIFLNSYTKLSATSSGDVVTITQTLVGTAGNTAITIVDPGTDGMTKIDFTGGCDLPDTDGDGNNGDVDDFPDDGDGLVDDTDGDGLADNVDACPSVPGTSFIDRIGCPDSDLDGWSDEGETVCNHDPNMVGSTPLDTDGDGICDRNDSDDDNDLYYDDLIMASGTGFADDCPRIWGNSTDERHGCPDSDGDGVADIDDGFPDDPSRSWDRDGDGISEEEEWFLDWVHQNYMPQFVVSLFVVLTLVFFLVIRIRSVD